jgi:hypothetical protein
VAVTASPAADDDQQALDMIDDIAQTVGISAFE